MWRIKAFFRRWLPAPVLTFLRWLLGRPARLPVEFVQVERWPAEKPLVSVVIPCFNHGHYLAEAVDSVLAQTWQNLEIIVVDDGSTRPDTRDVLGSFSRPKTRMLAHPENRGLPAARNTGIRAARGKYICCLDADDKLEATYVEKALLLMESNLGLSFVYPWAQVFGDESRVWEAPPFDPGELLQRCLLNPPAIFLRSAWEAAGGFREEMRNGYEDWEFWIRLAGLGLRGHRIPECLILVRRVGRSFIHAAMERHGELVTDIRRYNADLYEDPNLPEKIKAGYRDRFSRDPWVNLVEPGNYSQPVRPAVWINTSPKQLAGQRLGALQQELKEHKGETIFISTEVLDPEAEGVLRQAAKYVYVLPCYLPSHAWAGYLALLARRLPKDALIRKI